MRNNSKKRFHKNIERWAAFNAKKAWMLPYLNVPLSKVSTEFSKNFEMWKNSLSLDTTHVIFVYGIEDGQVYNILKPWLKKHRYHRLVFIEDDLSVIWQLFHQEVGTNILKDSQVSLYFFEDLEDLTTIFDVLHWDFFHQKIVVTASSRYSEEKKELFADLKHRILHDATVRESLIEEYLKYGAHFFRNFYFNLLQLPESYLGNKFFKKFKDVPAIICGAGPSLQKQLPLLNSLKEKALIFAGGSAMNALNSMEVFPHFGGGIDPNEMQLSRLETNRAVDVPYFYRNRMFYKAFRIIKGKRLYITGSGGYGVADWFEERLGIKSEWVDEGHNVINFLTEIAKLMECNPIIFIGMDLAYTDLKSYAPGIVEDNRVSPNEIIQNEGFDAAAFLKTDIFGKPVYTLWKWVAEAEAISKIAKENPHLKIFNATEGGIGFPQIENIPFEQAVKTYLTHDFSLEERVQNQIKKSKMPQVTLERVKDLIKEFCESMQRSQKCIVALVQEIERLKQEIKQKESFQGELQSGRMVLFEGDLADEPAFQHCLEIFNEVSVRLMNKEMQKLRLSKAPAWKIALKKLDHYKKRLSFLHNVTTVNIELMTMALEGREKFCV